MARTPAMQQAVSNALSLIAVLPLPRTLLALVNVKEAALQTSAILTPCTVDTQQANLN